VALRSTSGDAFLSEAFDIDERCGESCGAVSTDIRHLPARVVVTAADRRTPADGPRNVLDELSGVSERPMIIPMTTTARPQQRYDHRSDLVQGTGDVTIATDVGLT
jgi:hypothetical protein